MSDLPEYAVYVIEHEHGFVKIGASQNPEKRLQALQGGSPYQLKGRYIFRHLNRGYSPLDSRYEKVGHDEFEGRRVRGEWFDATPSEVLHFYARLEHEDEVGIYNITCFDGGPRR